MESTALGAAYLAGLAAGVYSSLEELENIRKAERIFVPDLSEELRASLYAKWQKAVRLSREWGQEA